LRQFKHELEIGMRGPLRSQTAVRFRARCPLPPAPDISPSSPSFLMPRTIPNANRHSTAQNRSTIYGSTPPFHPSQILQIRSLTTHATHFANPSSASHRAPPLANSRAPEMLVHSILLTARSGIAGLPHLLFFNRSLSHHGNGRNRCSMEDGSLRALARAA
jgi:hypothetical protein